MARLARNASEVEAAQRLRFEVFNVELNEGLERSYATGLDQDRFDAACDHLLVFHVPTRAVAGTYRVQAGMSALAGQGYYTEREFDLSPFEGLRSQIVEVGRACVDRRHRNLSALGVLWRGIARYALERRARYLIGCSSIPTVDPQAGWSVYRRLAASNLAPRGRRTRPRAGWECPPAGEGGAPFPVPKLLQAYLGLGAEICSEPARDSQFGTIDFLTFLDLDSLPPAARQRFLS